MVLKIEDKKAIVAEIADIATQALSVVVAEYRGLTVQEMTELRQKARKTGVYVRVVRNTLARRAVAESRFSCAQEILTGPVLLAFSQEDPGAAARLMRDFAKEHDKLVVKGLSLGESLLPAAQLAAVANLPTREQALGQLLSVMKAPVTKWVRTLAEPYAMLVRVVAAVRDQKQAA